MHPLFSLQGQKALITGAGSLEGIGFAAAQLLAEMGAEVAITATGSRIHQRVAELRKAGHTVRGYIVDLTDRPTTRSMIEAVEARLRPDRHFGEQCRHDHGRSNG